jgi:hypothetical protein
MEFQEFYGKFHEKFHGKISVKCLGKIPRIYGIP